MPNNQQFLLDPENDCLEHPGEGVAARTVNRHYVCRLTKGHAGSHAFVPVDMVIYERRSDDPKSVEPAI